MELKTQTIDLASHRAQFPALADRYYFNYGGQGPLANSTLNKISENFGKIESLGVFSRAANAWDVAESNLTRATIADQLKAQASNITLTESTTAGCNIALWSVDWQPGDHLLISDCEHPGIIGIADQLKQRFGIEVSFFSLQAYLDQGTDAILATIEQNLRSHTRMIAISHICWNTGHVMPLKQISQLCHAHDVLVMVDAAQSVGVLPLDLPDCEADFYAFTGHKWWCGPLGVGGLYVRDQAFDQALPTYIGWRGIKDCQLPEPGTQPEITWQQDGQKFEIASTSYPLYGALREAIAYANTWGSQAQRYDRICKLSKWLWQELGKLPKINLVRQTPPDSGLIAFTIKEKIPSQLMTELEEKENILLRSLNNPDCLRVSIHYLTTQSELEQLLAICSELAS
ncbi:Cysteine desulfurase [Thalassoporum mexicanum PCC 7367]|uniref:aminotransferase class V-fold PLP-dependent enzyme n=1 Tax=Thalassoporum mexicanum TaxID=3457544 RepID=UPI00029FFC6A|nr:aminotransferase class V-fold PLP-dependent enzyme [Pseudanabaena sp. PCC 7367]AFY70851.1 Cysteine desulfurase [Pseudanabaena sp. PCC 7367]